MAAAQAAADDDIRALPAELAVLVSVQFTGECRKLTVAARQARKSAAVLAASSAGANLDEILGSDAQHNSVTSDLNFESALAEFQELAHSAGATVAATLVQRRPRPDAATFVGQGELDEIEAVVASTNASVLHFDHDLSPSQLRNLDARLACRVIDRTQLILDLRATRANA